MQELLLVIAAIGVPIGWLIVIKDQSGPSVKLP
jgi:hypothetical protein